MNCILCNGKAKVQLVMPIVQSGFWDGLRELELRAFCLHCMAQISQSYENLYRNNFAGISRDEETI